MFCSKKWVFQLVEALISGWFVRVLGEHSSPVALNLQLVRHVLALVHELTVSTCTKTKACRGARFQCSAREKYSFPMRL